MRVDGLRAGENIPLRGSVEVHVVEQFFELLLAGAALVVREFGDLLVPGVLGGGVLIVFLGRVVVLSGGGRGGRG